MLRMFDFRCSKCDMVTERIVSLDLGEQPNCPQCGTTLDRLPVRFRVNMGPVGAYGYYDETLESYVSTNKQRKELMRRRDVTEKGATPKPFGDAWV
jgi:putative FmdB family regulatory protein